VIVLLSELLGKKKHFAAKDMPYECGMDPIGDAAAATRALLCHRHVLHRVRH